LSFEDGIIWLKRSKGEKMKRIDDKEWLRRNFKKLIEQYGGEFVLIANHKVFPVTESNVAKMEKILRKKYKTPPIGLPVPRKEDLSFVLTLSLK
jgi:hypothetical protein